MTHISHSLVLLGFVLFAGCKSNTKIPENSSIEEEQAIKKSLTRIEKSKVELAFWKRGGDPNNQTISLEEFGRSTWLIRSYTKGMSPSIPSRYLVDSRGDIRNLTVDSLNITFMNESFEDLDDSRRADLMKLYASLHSGGGIIILNKKEDITEYASAPLDEDIADAIRAPFKAKKEVFVVYTYQQIGGVVRRYRFTFKNEKRFRHAECALVGRDIGKAKYYQ